MVARRLSVLALPVVLLLGWPGMAQERQTNGHSPESKADNHQRDAPQSNPVIFPKQSVRAEGHKAPADDGKKQSDEKLPLTWKSPEWVIVDVTLVYTAFAALTWLAIWRQVNILKRQTSAMERQIAIAEESAKSAARSVSTFINRERSRLFIGWKITEDFEVSFHARNEGQSHARITYGFVSHELLTPEEDFPPIPDYTRGDRPADFAQDDWIAPGGSSEFGGDDAGYITASANRELFEEVMNRKYTLWFYGVVRYWDCIAQDLHELRCCYRCEPSRGGKHRLYEGGPDAYRGET